MLLFKKYVQYVEIKCLMKLRTAKIFQEHTFQGWRLVTMYTNEIGENALAVGGVGVNATMCEDILVFERCIKGETQ